jgi:hypothetical protein
VDAGRGGGQAQPAARLEPLVAAAAVRLIRQERCGSGGGEPHFHGAGPGRARAPGREPAGLPRRSEVDGVEAEPVARGEGDTLAPGAAGSLKSLSPCCASYDSASTTEPNAHTVAAEAGVPATAVAAAARSTAPAMTNSRLSAKRIN